MNTEILSLALIKIWILLTWAKKPIFTIVEHTNQSTQEHFSEKQNISSFFLTFRLSSLGDFNHKIPETPPVKWLTGGDKYYQTISVCILPYPIDMAIDESS